MGGGSWTDAYFGDDASCHGNSGKRAVFLKAGTLPAALHYPFMRAPCGVSAYALRRSRPPGPKLSFRGPPVLEGL